MNVCFRIRTYGETTLALVPWILPNRLFHSENEKWKAIVEPDQPVRFREQQQQRSSADPGVLAGAQAAPVQLDERAVRRALAKTRLIGKQLQGQRYRGYAGLA